MPKGTNSKPLHPHEISKIEKWIKQGAHNDSPKGSENVYSMKKKTGLSDATTRTYT